MKSCYLIKESGFSNAQFYNWLKNIHERKKRDKKFIAQDVAEAAVEVIKEYPHFSATKGQGYMIYHQKGYIPQHIYKLLKKVTKRLIIQEVSKRGLLPERTSYEHERPDMAGEIWAEDFTNVRIAGEKFYIGLLIDVASNYYLGVSVSRRADEKMVELPVKKALEINEGHGPKRFLLSDNGPQYISAEHGDLLDKLEIVQKRIPSCKPEYNGSVECGVKEFKNVFYNVWATREAKGADKGKRLLERVQRAVEETSKRMNFEIPRPCLRGVTADDVQKGIAEEKIKINKDYLAQEQKRKEVIQPWTKSKWNLVKVRMSSIIDGEILFFMHDN
jgi:hypothetical protein